MALSGVGSLLSRNSKLLQAIASLVVIVSVVPVMWRWAGRNLGSDLDVQEDWSSGTIPPDIADWADRVSSSLTSLVDFESRPPENKPDILLDDLLREGQSTVTARLAHNPLTPDEGLLAIRVQNNLNDAVPGVRLRIDRVVRYWTVRLSGDFLDENEVKAFDSAMDAQNAQSHAIVADLPTIAARGFVTVSVYGDTDLSDVFVSAPGRTVRIRKTIEVNDSTLIWIARNPFASLWFFGWLAIVLIFVTWMWALESAVRRRMPYLLYDLACGDAKVGERASALVLLAKAFESGYSDKNHARNDDAFSSLRELPEFRSLVGE